MPKTRPRGFIVVVLLAIAAVIAALVAGQLMTAQKGTVIGVRSQEEAQARAIAEACLEMLTQYAQNLDAPDAGVTPTPNDDFDAVLNGPNHVSGPNPDGDDFLPFAVRKVKIPPSATDQVHTWELIDIANPTSGVNSTSTTGGLCAARFDDNSDDGRAPLPGSGTAEAGHNEGGATDLPQYDRDLSVYLTVIGLYPVLPGTTDVNAYAKAHARVTLRRLVQKSNITAPANAGMWAGGTVQVHDNNHLCGFGGVIANNLQTNNNSCFCGTTDVPSGGCTGNSCPQNGQSCATCPSCSPETVSNAAPAAPPLNVHWGDVVGAGYLDLDAIGSMPRVDPHLAPADGQGVSSEPPTPTHDLASSQFCAFFGTSSYDFFVWDRLDTDARHTLEDLADDGVANNSVAVEGTVLQGSIPGTDTNGDTFPDTPVNCTSMTTNPIPRPCTWTPGAATPSARISCTAAQSPCWKLVARMGISPAQPALAPVGIEPVPTPGLNDGGGNNAFKPILAVPIPNTTRAGQPLSVFGAPVGPEVSLCGDPTSCSQCNGTQAPIRVESTGHWHFDVGADNEHAPSPGVYILENTTSPDRDIHVANSGSGSGPFRATLIGNGKAFVENNAALCCATCNCATVGTATSGGSCALDGAFGGSGTAAPNIANIDTANVGNEKLTSDSPSNVGLVGGPAIKVASLMAMHNGAFIVGDLRAGGVDFHDNSCLVGSAVGYDASLSISSFGIAGCNSAPCGTSNICFHDNAHIIGDVESMNNIDMHDNPKIWGDVVSKQNMCFHDNVKVDGTLEAGNNIDLHDNALIINNEQGTGSGSQKANDALTTFMEASW